MAGTSAGTTGRPFGRPFLISFLLFVGLTQLWSLATLLDGGPDERVQIIKAAAVVRGEWLGGSVKDIPAETRVDVPEAYAKIGAGDCAAFKPDVPIGTCPAPPTSSETVSTTTYVGHYPPLYYLLIGWPSFIGTRWSIFLVRLLSAIFDSAFLALAVAATVRWSRSILLLAALAVAATPTVIFFMSVVNPSGLEMTAGIAMWTTAVIVVTSGRKRPPPLGLLGVLTLSVCVEILVRGDSFVWVIACAFAVAPLAAGGLKLGPESIRFVQRVALPAVTLSAIAAAVWMLVGHPLTVLKLAVPPASTPESLIVRQVLGGAGTTIQQMIGVFGWLDTPVPSITFLAWYGITFALLSVSVFIGLRRHLISLGLTIAASIFVPLVLILVSIRSSGPLSAGRYFLPLVVGIPIVAGAVSSQVGLPRWPAARLSTVIFALAAVGQIAAAYWALRRYLVGMDGPLAPWATVPGVWRPPLPAWLLDLGFVVAWLAIAALATWHIRSFNRLRSLEPAHDGREGGSTAAL